MLRVDSSKPCTIVYSLCRHEFLGFLIEPHIVQLNAQNNYLLTHQRLFSTTAGEFSGILDQSDLALIAILDECEQEHLIRSYLKKPVRPSAFFAGYTEQMHAWFRPRLDRKLNEVLRMLPGKSFFEMGKDGNPTSSELSIAHEKASILFHFRRNEEGTRYFPTIRYQGRRIEFMFKNASVVCNSPAWLLLDQQLFSFNSSVEGKKLFPFLNKRFIEIPKSSEHVYFNKFVLPLIEKYPVYAEGLTIINQKAKPQAILKLNAAAYGENFVNLSFRYGDQEFSSTQELAVSVYLERNGNIYTFLKIRRLKEWEKEKCEELKALGLRSRDLTFFSLEEKLPLATADIQHPGLLEWVNSHYDELLMCGFKIEQSQRGKQYFLGEQRVNLEIRESNDWFDVTATVVFGSYEIPFIRLRNHIINRIREFELPGGEIALIPEHWFSQYGHLFALAEPGEEFKLKKLHIGIVREYSENRAVNVRFTEKLKGLVGAIEIDPYPLPQDLRAELRPYQYAGYNWFSYLRDCSLGGCLADDMGLGKTIQTLALLERVHEQSRPLGPCSLVIMPTSLIHNWLGEASRFVPSLRVYVHTGSDRIKDEKAFKQADVVFSTYGIVRLDETFLSSCFFEYIILDESQYMKNPASKISKTVRKLRSSHKLILSGTPMENSVSDLWSQMSFINPGLLGTHSFFNEHFIFPIEKKGDVERLRKLQSLVKPFILRRTKQQVAGELPPKTEQVFYSDMTSEQDEVYERVRSAYRNQILLLKSGMAPVGDGGELGGTYGSGLGGSSVAGARSRFSVLQGLTRLRQIANHPVLEDAGYEGDSGKFNDAVDLLASTLSEGHKVLVFSSFTRHLALFKKYLDEEGTRYAYLDGSTVHRQEAVASFRNDKDLRIFLISIRAGGIGLNLIEADYVFILDPWWNPAVERQAIDRTHRIGQTKNVFIYKFITKNSVEEKIQALQAKKQVITDSLIQMEDSFLKQLSWQEILSVLE